MTQNGNPSNGAYQPNGPNGPEGSAGEAADNFDIRASLRMIADAIRHQKRMILATCVFSMILTTVYFIAWPSVYDASAMIMVERDIDPVRDSFYIGWNVFRKDDARSEMELMLTGPVLREVVEREGLQYEDVYHPFMSHLTFLWGESWVGKTYRGFKKSLFSGDDASAVSDEDVLLGRTIVDMRAGISLDAIGESNVGRLIVKGPTRRVADVANTLLDVYMERRKQRYVSEAKKSYDILSNEVRKAGERMDEIERQRLAFIEEHSIGFEFEKELAEMTRLNELEAGIGVSEITAASLTARLAAIDRQFAAEPETRTTATIFGRNTIREAAKMKRLELRTALLQVENRFRADSPEVLEVKSDIEELDAMIAAAEENVESSSTEMLNDRREGLKTMRNSIVAELEGARAGLSVMRRSADKLSKRQLAVPGLQAALRALDREAALRLEIHQQLVAKQAQSAVSVTTAASAMSSMRVVEYAVPPDKKAWPDWKILYPVSLLAALALGIGAAVVIDDAGGRVRRADVEAGRLQTAYYTTIELGDESLPFRVVKTKTRVDQS